MVSWEIYEIFKVSEFFQKQEVFCRKGVFKNFCNIHEKTPVLEPFFDKVADPQAAAFRTATLSKRDSTTDSFLLILRIF